MVYFWVGIAGAFGAILRYLIGVTFFTASSFPYATLFINLFGSYLLAVLTTRIFRKTTLPSHLTTAIGTGFVGSFTTFSALSVETVELFRNENLFLGFLYVFISITGGLIMSRLGFDMESEEVQKT
ncbi:fluoride efflux transporter CrcB [Oceanobacillus piezotolerans]|uniref:Fluoride-specific ion channel FluC n=1 Tax=Oceanobacillus piezotolerans TaxID=2448030 RepID=A0A498DP17_9BACI|nr:fluoride efflux transporter CrcB [Oceanobacillus piezotolerans]RLL45472.1 fluoride efflux transporter CrcB [Oceanobacillus piezotolerans]